MSALRWGKGCGRYPSHRWHARASSPVGLIAASALLVLATTRLSPLFVGDLAPDGLYRPPPAPVHVRPVAQIDTGAAVLALAGAAPQHRATAALLSRAAVAGNEGENTGGDSGEWQLWLDLRKGKKINIDGVWMESPDANDAPEVMKVMTELTKTVREKFDNIGLAPPRLPIVQGVLVDSCGITYALNQSEELRLPLFVAIREIDGTRLPGVRSLFVCNAKTKEPVAALAAPPVQFGTAKKPQLSEVRRILPAEDWEDAIREKEESDAQEMEAYMRGVNGEGEYLWPSRRRMRELFGFVDHDEAVPTLPIGFGQLLAKAVPPDALLWARELVKRQREVSGETPSYNLRSDREKAAAAAAAASAAAL